MAMINFKKGLRTNLPATYSEGTFYVTTDERAIYLDVSDSARIRIGDFQEFATIADLTANTNPNTTVLYYVSDINCLAKWNGTEYIQINRDTGMTSVEVVGEGNAVTAAVYSADGRKLTLTKGATYMTSADVDGKISDKVGAIEGTVKAYVDEKTTGIASSDALNTLAGRVSTAEGKITTIETAIAEGGSVANAIAAAKKAGDDAQADVDALENVVSEYKTSNDAALAGVKTTAEKGVSDAAAAKAAADAAAELAGTKATMAEVNSAIEGAGHAVKADVDKAIADLETAYAAADSALKTELEGKINLKADKTVVDGVDGRVAAIEADYLKTADKYDDTKVKADIAANLAAIGELQGDVDVLNGDAETEGSVDYKIAQAVAAIMENPDETMNSINELVTWINGHAEDALELSNKVTKNEQDIDALEALVGTTGVATQIEAAITEALKIDGVDKYALASDLTAAIARIVALESDTHTHGNKTVLDGITSEKVAAWDAAEANAKAYADGLAGNYDAAGSAAQTLVDAKAYADQAEADAVAAAEAKVKALADGQVKTNTEAIATKADQTALDGVAGRVTTAEGKITALETASATHALKTEVEAVQTALNTYKASNDAAVALKANSADVYAKTETYTQEEVNDAIAAALEQATSWGSF